jgi:hypothetical protein
MRAVIFILILAVVVVLIAIATGFLDISQTRTAKVPDISVNKSGIAARGGRTPAFDVETGSVSLGSKKSQVTVPTVAVNPPDGANQEASNVAANAG